MLRLSSVVVSLVFSVFGWVRYALFPTVKLGARPGFVGRTRRAGDVQLGHERHIFGAEGWGPCGLRHSRGVVDISSAGGLSHRCVCDGEGRGGMGNMPRRYDSFMIKGVVTPYLNAMGIFWVSSTCCSCIAGNADDKSAAECVDRNIVCLCSR